MNISLPVLKRDHIISGRWERGHYKVLNRIGCGGNGSVYLVEDRKGLLKAVKISTDIYSITCEYRTMIYLRCCHELKASHIMPQVYELDEFQMGQTVYHFIVMEYCPGKNLGLYKGRLDELDAIKVGKQISAFLNDLHKAGLVFGDLKPSNIIYDFDTGSVKVIDYGSVTVKGKRLNQFTPGYDRASWQAGSRTADERYDMFALGIFLAAMVLGKLCSCNNSQQLYSRVMERIKNRDFKNIVLKALTQTANNCGELADNLSCLLEEWIPPDRLSTGTVVNYFGAASAASFIASLVYYYSVR